jgi:CRP-like cAMP-binding protein
MPRASRSSKIDLLKNVALFSRCSASELQQIAQLADEVDVEQGRVLTREGRPGREYFVIAEGNAKVTLRNKKLNELGPGESFGEMSLLDMGPRSATIVAQTPMKLFVMDARGFATFLDKAPSAARSIMRSLAERLRAQERPKTTH